MDWTKAKWRKSNFSSGGSCVEVAKLGDVVGVRDTKAQGRGPVLEFNRSEWAAFLAGVADGQFEFDVLDR